MGSPVQIMLPKVYKMPTLDSWIEVSMQDEEPFNGRTFDEVENVIEKTENQIS